MRRTRASERVLDELGLRRRTLLAFLGAEVHAVADAVVSLRPAEVVAQRHLRCDVTSPVSVTMGFLSMGFLSSEKAHGVTQALSWEIDLLVDLLFPLGRGEWLGAQIKVDR